jgi:hypothetical protein
MSFQYWQLFKKFENLQVQFESQAWFHVNNTFLGVENCIGMESCKKLRLVTCLQSSNDLPTFQKHSICLSKEHELVFNSYFFTFLV